MLRLYVGAEFYVFLEYLAAKGTDYLGWVECIFFPIAFGDIQDRDANTGTGRAVRGAADVVLHDRIHGLVDGLMGARVVIAAPLVLVAFPAHLTEEPSHPLG